MKAVALESGCEYGAAGIFRGHLSFDNPRLADYKWEICEIRGTEPGPRLCVCAGVHPNEVSSIEAAVRLQKMFDPQDIKGSISIIPLVNQPALYQYSQYVCPIDGKNIEHTFPGKQDGTFSEALCEAIINEWCANADCLINMHGGDLREKVSKFVMFQQTGDTEFNVRARQLARCFDAEFVLAVPKRYLDQEGSYSFTALARVGRLAVLPEAGANGLVTADAVSYHVDGVQNVARTLGIIDTPLSEFQNSRIPCNDYHWVNCPVSGDFHSAVEPADRVAKGQLLGTVYDKFGAKLADVGAPSDGFVLWRVTHPSIKEGAFIMAVSPEEIG